MIKPAKYFGLMYLEILLASASLNFLTTTALSAPLNKALAAMAYAETAPCASPIINPMGIDLGNPCKIFTDTAIKAEFIGGTTWRTQASGSNCVTITSTSLWNSGNQVVICKAGSASSGGRACGTARNQCYCDASNPDYIIRWLSNDPSCLARQTTLNKRLTNTVTFLSGCTADIKNGSPCRYLVETP